MTNQNLTAYLLGEKLTYSYSKIIHESFGKVSYELKPVNEKELIKFILNKEYDFVNITNPYKSIVIPCLDACEKVVLDTNVCNLIINKDNKLYGYNTDYLGFKKSLKYDYQDKVVLILGTGCTSKSINYVLKNKSKEIIFATRGKTNQEENIYNYHDLDKVKNKINFIVNTTPNGTLSFSDETLVDLKEFPNLEYVYDVVYNPYRTNLLLQSRELNIPYQNGLDMLIHQGWLAEKLFFNEELNVDLNKIKNKFLNITLIGMPNSGKSTIGKELSKIYHKQLFDTDIEIEKKNNIIIKDYLNKNTEASFRKMEEDIILNNTFNNTIISTGGGMILNSTIMNYLKKNSIIIYLQKDLNDLIYDDNHPLSNNKKDLEKIYFERKDLYKKYADIIIDNNDLNETIKEIEERVNEKEHINN